MKQLFSLFVLFSIFSVNMVAQDGSSVFSKNWIEEAERLHAGCTYARSMRGTERAVLYYSIKEKEEIDGIKHSKMYVDVVELDNLAEGGPIHEMGYIDDEYPNDTTCTDVLLIRQKGDKVYCQSEDGTKEWLLLDFGLKAGDTYVDGAGKCYLVKEVTNYKDTKHKALHLQSEDGTEEDTWVEGIGSLQWGFLPGYVAKSLKYFQNADSPLCVSLWSGFSPDCFFDQSINDEYFKLQPFKEVKDEETENMGYEDLPEPPTLSCSFDGSDLLVRGYYYLNLYHSYVAVCVSGTRIDVSVHQLTPLNIIKGMHVAKVDVRIPGFKAGTYQVGMPGREYVTLECKGITTQIENVRAEGMASNTIYDLQGRRIGNSQLKKGLYILNGKKVMIR
jgi:predicted heme/steroid binding protein